MKIISLLICILFLASIFIGLTTAKNLVSIEVRVNDSNVDLKGDRDLIKIIDDDVTCDLYNDFVVYENITILNIYDIKTGETENVYVGGNIVFPKISENRVVYYDFTYNGFKIFNIDTSEKTDLIVTNWPGGDSDDFQFYGDYIIYENTDSGIYDTEIFLYNIATGKNIQLTDSPGEDYPENPCIYENIVAWQLTEGNIADIVMYDIDSEKYTRVTNTSQFESETFPSIYDNNIVYSYLYYDKVNGTKIYGLKMYNITSGDETSILTGEESTGSTPEIFDNMIAYSEVGASLRLYDLKTNNDISIYEGDMLAYPWNLNELYVLFTIVQDGVYIYRYNNPPDPPEISGPNSGNPGIEYEFIFNALDSDGDDVKYIIDWGDDNTYMTDFNPSGTDVKVNNTWSEKGNYKIKAKAVDTYNAESSWSEFEINIPRTKTTFTSYFYWFLENFPMLKILLLFVI
ncbi:MAG: hypothetical protein AYK22_05250 [Thermoplasmatales archaeon SG8-52-3]|nr:MAG: hypothetical protein AYK22_05250 [Thermoplasmatales archaeon SG8-52-3]